MRRRENGTVVFDEGDHVHLALRLHSHYPDIARKNGYIVAKWAEDLYMVDFSEGRVDGSPNHGVYFFSGNELDFVFNIKISGTNGNVSEGDWILTFPKKK